MANYIPQVSLVHSSLLRSPYNVDNSSAGEDGPCKVGSKVSWQVQSIKCKVQRAKWAVGELANHSPSSSAFARLTDSVTLLATAMTSSAFNRPACHSHTPSGNDNIISTFWLCMGNTPSSLAHLGSERVGQFMGEEPSGRGYDEIALDANGQPHNPMINRCHKTPSKSLERKSLNFTKQWRDPLCVHASLHGPT